MKRIRKKKKKRLIVCLECTRRQKILPMNTLTESKWQPPCSETNSVRCSGIKRSLMYAKLPYGHCDDEMESSEFTA
jgi:hypothetical protein